jgi:hypothetical protein
MNGERMNPQVELSGQDETIANSLYSGLGAESTRPPLIVAPFQYAFTRQSSLLRETASVFGAAITQPLPAEHREMVEGGESQSAEDLAVARRMHDVKQDAWTS